jgi:hypothetical protein
MFNWHPLLMMLAFVGCMAEAIMTYSTTPSSLSFHIPETNRPMKKAVHGALHGLALLLSLLGIVAAIQSHTQKKPMPVRRPCRIDDGDDDGEPGSLVVSRSSLPSRSLLTLSTAPARCPTFTRRTRIWACSRC